MSSGSSAGETASIGVRLSPQSAEPPICTRNFPTLKTRFTLHAISTSAFTTGLSRSAAFTVTSRVGEMATTHFPITVARRGENSRTIAPRFTSLFGSRSMSCTRENQPLSSPAPVTGTRMRLSSGRTLNAFSFHTASLCDQPFSAPSMIWLSSFGAAGSATSKSDTAGRQFTRPMVTRRSPSGSM